MSGAAAGRVWEHPPTTGPATRAPHGDPLRVERRRHAAEAGPRQVLEAARDAYVAVDAQGCVVDWNAEAERLFGVPRAGAVGRPVSAFVAPRDREAFVAGLEAALTQGVTATEPVLQVLARTGQGRDFLAECSVWGVERRGSVVLHAFVRDVTEGHARALAAARLAAVVDGSPDAIFVRSLRGTMLCWNAAAERIFGWSAAEVIGGPSSAVLPDEDPVELARQFARLGRGEAVLGVETERVTRSGALVPLSMQSSPIRDRTGRVVAIGTIARDVSEQRWMSETLDHTLAVLQVAADEAQASEETTRRFLDDAAHQLRTPVASIQACAQALQRDVPAADRERLLGLLVRETSRASRLISSLLTIAALDQGVPLAVEPVDVVLASREELERSAVLAPHVDVVLEVHGDGGRLAMADGMRLREILSNLGDNARRHAVSRIRCTVQGDRETVRVRVVDDGPGVEPTQVARVFERFVSNDGHGGSGLGLSVARELARAMHGDLCYDGGFVLTLPAA